MILAIAGLLVQAVALGAAPAADAVGKFDAVFSPARQYVLAVNRGGIDVQLTVGQSLQAGDRVRTPKGQTVSLELATGTVIVLGEGAEAALGAHPELELKAGSAFVHVASSYHAPKYFMVALRKGLLGAERGDFEARVQGDAVTVYSISSPVSYALDAEALDDMRKRIFIDEGYSVRLVSGSGQPDTYLRPNLFAFEKDDRLFGMLVGKFRETRFPLPHANRSTEGGGGAGGGAGAAVPGAPAMAVPAGGGARGW